MRDRKKAQALAHELVSKMTIEERASQLKFDAPPVERLGVPAYNWWNEALHGVARAGTATMFPQPVAMASMFDPEMIRKIGDVVATEARAKYNEASKHGDRDIYKGLTFWSPNINLFRDPRWGRGQETYSEDPYLTAQLGVAYIKGLQGDGKYLKVAACAKHYAVHSGPEAIRHEFDAEVSQKDLWETYLPAFEAAVKEGEVEAVMGAYNRTLGEPCCGSDLLIRKILRGKWGFQGHFVSDCWAISDFHLHHHITTTAPESAALAIKMGCDVNCGNTYLHLLRALEDGLITEDDITTAAERLFTTRFMLGEFDENCEYNSIPYEVVECPEHLALSEEAARRSVVLLKNDGILPLDKTKIKMIGVIGPNANDRMALIGNYHGTASRYITVLEGIQDYVGDDVRVLYAEGCHLYKDRVEGLGLPGDRLSEAETVAEHSDVVVLVTGLNENLEGEEMDQSNSVGSGDKANLLLPAFTDYAMENRTYRYFTGGVLYPFGYGLTYGKTEVTKAEMRDDGEHYTITATVKNEDCAVHEILQVYVRDNESEFAVRNHSLCAFKAVSLGANETCDVEITVPKTALEIVDDTGTRRVDSRSFTFFVGTSQPDDRSTELLGTRPVAVELKL